MGREVYDKKRIWDKRVFGPYFTKWEGKFMIRREFGTRDKEGGEKGKIVLLIQCPLPYRVCEPK